MDLPGITRSSAPEGAALACKAAEAKSVLVPLMNSRLSKAGSYSEFDLEIK
jgi:hypothetical protein